MIICTTDYVPGREVENYLGLAKGCTVRATHSGDDLVAKMKNTLGGEIHEYTKIMAEAREQALDRLMEDARKLGADAIIGLRFATSEIDDHAAEMMCYGTAVSLVEKAIKD